MEVDLFGFAPQRQDAQVTVDSFVVRTTTPVPDTVAVTDTQSIVLEVANAADSLFRNLPVFWQSTDPNIVSVVPTGTDSTEFIAHSAGSAEVIARIDPNGIRPQEVRFPMVVTPIVVEIGTWPNLRGAVDTNFTVATDTVFVDIRITNRGVVMQRVLPIRWESDDPSLEVTRIQPPDTTEAAMLAAQTRARVIARSRGGGRIKVILGTPGETEESSDSISVHVLVRWIDTSAGGAHT